MTIRLTGGDYKVKIDINLIFTHILITTLSGTLNGKTFTFGSGVDYKYSFKLGKEATLDVEVDAKAETASFSVSVLGFKVYGHTISLDEILNGKSYTVHGFNEHGVSLTPVIITAS